MNVPSSHRSTEAVIESHLRYRRTGDLERDLAENYGSDVVVLSAEGVSRGHDGVRRLAAILRSYVGNGSYSYDQILAEGEIAMLQWSGKGSDIDIHDGADSYVVRDGVIIAQTIHYSTHPQ